jgi:hypothetical protein
MENESLFLAVGVAGSQVSGKAGNVVVHALARIVLKLLGFCVGPGVGHFVALKTFFHENIFAGPEEQNLLLTFTMEVCIPVTYAFVSIVAQ